MADTSLNADVTWRSTTHTNQLIPTMISPSGNAISRWSG